MLQIVIVLLVMSFFNYVLFILVVLLLVAFLVLYERNILGYIQERNGPNVVGVFSLVQTVYDSLKLLTNNSINFSSFFFIMIPMYSMLLSLLQWLFLPLPIPLFQGEYTILLTFIVSGMLVYVVLSCGWQSVNSYGVIGSIRSVSQMISYEVVFFFFLMALIITSLSFNWAGFLSSVNFEQTNFSLFFILVWTVIVIAELNRSPFDLVESESELVSGFNTEYLGYNFTLLFLSEYANIWIMSLIFSIIFAGPLVDITSLSLLFVSLCVLIRGFLPRLNFSDLINLTWNVCLPFIMLLILYFLLF